MCPFDLESFNAFSNDKFNAYFWQEYICNQEYKVCGGLRGIVWRSMFRQKLYDSSKISSLPDTRLMFNMTEHAMNNTHDQNDTFLDILEDIHDRSTGFQADVTIPFDRKTADEILMEREFGIYGNLPHEEVFNIGGHACVSLIGVFKQINAHQIPIGFTEQTDIPGDTHDRSNTNGSLAMDEFAEIYERAKSR